MNPFDFVRIDYSKDVPRRPAPLHDRFTGLSGRIEGTITALTPLFIPGGEKGGVRQFRLNRAKQPIIPASSLKGLMRSLVETLGPGCWWLLDRQHQDSLDPEFRQCSDRRALCPACRMFGMMQTGKNAPMLEGHVRFNDGVCSDPKLYPPMYTPILANPKPHHTAWYFAGGGGQPTGRKFYYHQPTVTQASGAKLTVAAAQQQNMEIAPLDAGCVFAFSAAFESVAEDDLNLLLYALVLEPEMRHKIGYAKPAGLGSVEIKLTKLTAHDLQRRYAAGGGRRGGDALEGEALAAYLDAAVKQAAAAAAAVTLEDLRRIWAWPPKAAKYQYPTEAWFDSNPNAPVSSAP